MPLSRQTIPVIALIALSAGCKEHPDAGRNDNTAPNATTAAPTPTAPQTSVIGSWSGMLETNGYVKTVDKTTGDSILISPNKITLFIDRMDNGEISGYSVCAGNDRPFKGTYKEEDGRITATLMEPGDNKNDGTFELAISQNPLSITGKWAPFDPSLPARHYTLTRKNFAYDPTAGNYTETSTRLLTSDDVDNLYKDDLRYMRNEIYARHGYSFRLKEVRSMFDNKDWYMPISTDVRKKLTAIELKNEQLIKHYEKYAEDNYDDFGR